MTTAQEFRVQAEPAATPLWESHSRALGRTARLALVGGDIGLLEDAGARLAYLHSLWESEVRLSDTARLRDRPGVVMDVAPETVLLVALAVEAARMAAGAPPERVDDVVVDARHGRVGIPLGIDLRLGGLARALAADLLAADLVDAGAAGVLVTIGDSSRVEGAAPRRDGWLIPAAGGLYRLRGGGLSALRSAPGRDVPPRTTVAVVAAEAWRAHALVRTIDRTDPATAASLLAAASGRSLDGVVPPAGFEPAAPIVVPSGANAGTSVPEQ